MCGYRRIYILYIYIRHFNNTCCSPNNKHAYLKTQIIEQVFNNNQFSIEDLLWEREKYWQAQLFTNLYGMNNINIDIV